MNLEPFLLLIILILTSAPLIYLAGRLQHRLPDRLSGRLSAWLAFSVLLAGWIPLLMATSRLTQLGPIAVYIETIPLRFDGLSLLLSGLALILGTLVVLFSIPYMAGEEGEEKFYAMLVTMIGVMIALSCAADLFNLWVWFEAMAISSYLLVMFYRQQPASLEAGVKYVVQSAAGSTLVLMGIALVLMQTGALQFTLIHKAATPTPILLAAGGLFLIGFGVKTALVPVHTWLPDAHSQAPSGISAMLSGVVIEAGLVAMLRSIGPLAGLDGQGYPPATWGMILIGLGALNMIIGNLMALRQSQVKRLLAYSSLSHVGYMIFGLGAALYAGGLAGAQGSLAGAQGGMFHLLNHGIMKGLAFLAAGALLYAITSAAASSQPHLGTQDQSHGPLTIADLGGAAQRYPLAALAFSLALLGLGGLPPLAGFMSKWQIFVGGFNTQNAWIIALAVFAALNSVLSLAYYAPLVNSMYRKRASLAVQSGAAIPIQMSLPLLLLSLVVVLFGLWPSLAAWITAPAGQAVLSAFGL